MMFIQVNKPFSKLMLMMSIHIFCKSIGFMIDYFPSIANQIVIHLCFHSISSFFQNSKRHPFVCFHSIIFKISRITYPPARAPIYLPACGLKIKKTVLVNRINKILYENHKKEKICTKQGKGMWIKSIPTCS